MAKGKHAAALFEVIHGDRRSERNISGSGALRTPKWWFKGRATSGIEPAAPISTSVPDPGAIADSRPQDTGNGGGSGGGFSIPLPRFKASLDSDRQQISFRLTYTSAIIAGFAVVVAIVVAYMAGRHGAISPRPVRADRTTDEIRVGPVLPNVLEPRRNETGATPPVVENVIPTAPTPQPNSGAKSPAVSEPRPPATLVVDNAKREINLNYVIVQSYPEEKNAMEARDLLIKSGIPCTVEKCPPDWISRSWFSVIGTRGFTRLSNSPEYDAYVHSIEVVSTKFGGNSKFKKFEPKPYKWKDAK